MSCIRFPLRLPFSKVFPTCCRDVSFFVHQFYQFAEGFSQTHGEMDDILKKVFSICNRTVFLLLTFRRQWTVYLFKK